MIYTLWLKPRSPLNIVIGGAAGSFAVLSGGGALGAWADRGVLLLALLLFFWTPAHFWALATVYRCDYARAGVPMLPVKRGVPATVRWMLVHSLAVAVLGLLLTSQPALGAGYLLVAAEPIRVGASTRLLGWLATTKRLPTRVPGDHP